MSIRFCLICFLSTFNLLCLPVVAQQFKVGDQVEADLTHLGIWKSGVITECLPFNRYRVQIDEERGRYEPTVCLEQFMRAGGRPPAQATGKPSSASASQAGTSPAFKVGDRVDADLTHIGIWKSGVVTEVLPYDRYRVLLDEDRGRHDPMVCLVQYMKAGTGSAPISSPSTAALSTPRSPAQAHGSNAAPAQSHASPSAQHSAAKPATADSESAEGLPPGQGMPPSGVYIAQKMSPGGGYLGLGELEIRGNTYRGIAGGSFAPFSVSGGKISWSQGIKGMPDGWVIRHSVYRGLDNMGRPYIQVYYRSRSGFNDCFDCVKEK